MTTFENQKGETLVVRTEFTHSFKGKGGWDINCQATYAGHNKTFKTYTTDTKFIDIINDMKGGAYSWLDVQNTYFNEFIDTFKERIVEWGEEIEANKEI